MKRCWNCQSIISKPRRKFCSKKCIQAFYDRLRKGLVDRIVWKHEYYKKNRKVILLQNEVSRLRHLKQDLDRKAKYRLKRKLQALVI